MSHIKGFLYLDNNFCHFIQNIYDENAINENNKKKKEAKKNSNTNIFKSFLSINKSNARDNNKSEDFDADFYRYYNDIGDIMINYIKEKKDKDKGYDNTNEVIIALTILGFIDCDILIRDVLNFYVEHCLILAKGQDKNIKIKVIKLANSKWIPEIENKKSRSHVLTYEVENSDIQDEFTLKF